MLSTLTSNNFSQSISNSSGEYFVKYTISHTFTFSTGIFLPSGEILPSHTANTSPFQGFSLLVGAVIIPEAVLGSSFIGLTKT